MTKLNELAQQILAAKYYQTGETCPEEVFSRVADVCAIPDAIDAILGTVPANTAIIDDEQLKIIFHDRFPLARRALDRRIRTLMQDESLHAPFNKISIDCDAIFSFWKKSADRYYNAMCALEFMPATPTLMNAGVGGMLSSCFAIRVQDSMEGIFDVVKEVAIISQKGGGCGLDVSDLRPEGSPVGSRGGVSSGPISFLKVFNEAGNQVKQGGARRAALLAGMRVDHPDILKFIRCKEVEGELSNFNISVFITDAFMRAVKDDTMILLQHPKETTTKTIRAREIWQEIINRSWSNGEPGIIFQDKLDKDDVVHGKYGKLLVNPCVTEDTWVFTESGPQKVKKLLNGMDAINVYVDGTKYSATNFFNTGKKSTIVLHTVEGFEVELTRNHLVQKLLRRKYTTPNRGETTANIKYETGWIEAGELSINDKIRIHTHHDVHWAGERGTYNEGYILGLMFGDGCLSGNLGFVEVWEHDGCADSLMVPALECVKHAHKRSDFNGFFYSTKDKKYRLKLKYIADLARDFGMVSGNKHITDTIESASSDFYSGFLRGAFDTDGSVQGTQQKGVSVRLGQAHKQDLIRIQRMLLRLGIFSRLYLRKEAGTTILPDSHRNPKEYPTKEMYELVISGDNIPTFVSRVGFNHSNKKDRLAKLLNGYKRKLNRTDPFVTIETVEEKPQLQNVYDVRVSDVHMFDGNGFYLHNCSELPLNSYSSCNLASINIAQFITNDNKFDINKFSATVQLGIQFLDNVIDINNYPLQKIEDITLALRPIGLGIMGLHDLMLHMGIEYGTNESLELIDLIYSTMKNTAKNWSSLLAHRGIPQDLKDAGLLQRNGYLLTAPPTGTISIICNQTSSGIEPVFQWEYTRNDSYGTHTMQHFIAKKYGKALPQYAKTALEISPEAHVRVQAQVQKYLDESVSKTVNLPSTATKEDIDKIFQLAYSLDCKSITVYRSGSRKEEVLVKKEDPKPVIKDEEDAGIISKAERTTGIIEPKVSPRPAVLFGSTYCIRTNLGKCYITINEDRSGVREVFITLSKAGSTMNAHCSVEGRLISNQLKYGVPISSIINHLKDTKDVPTWWNGIQINSVPDAVAKALEDYVRNFEGFSEFIEIPANDGCMLPQHTPQHTQEFFEPCPECGSALKRESGCKSCSCGYSACG